MTDTETTFIKELVSIYSPTGEERGAAEFLVARFAEWGWDARIDDAGNAVAEIGDGPSTLCFLGHIDTVRGEIPVRVEDDLLYGRGSVDAKGPLAAFACGLARCADDLRHLKVRLIGAVEEECRTSKGARFAIENYARPDFLVIGEPSGWNRLTLGYKGLLNFSWRLAQERAHGAAEEPAPATKAAACWRQILLHYPPDPERPDSPFFNLTGNIRAINTKNDETSEAVEMTVDLRLPPGLDPAEVEAFVRDVDPAAQVDIHEALPAVRGEKTGPLVAAFLKAIRGAGGKPGFSLKTGTADMNVAAPVWDCPVLAYGPGDSHLDHTPHEHLDLGDYAHAIDVAESALRTLDSRLTQ